jgi:hypothetical protein
LQGELLPPVAPSDVRGAIRLVDYFKSHLARMDQQMTSGIGSADAWALVNWIKRHRRDSFLEADITKDLRRFRFSPHDLAAALGVLKALAVIRSRPETLDPSRPGPKPSPAYDVHPDLYKDAPEITSNDAIPPDPYRNQSNCLINGNSRRSQENGSASSREVFEL